MFSKVILTTQKYTVTPQAWYHFTPTKCGSYIILSTGLSCLCKAREKPNRLSGSPFLRRTLSVSRLKADSRPHSKRKTSSSDTPRAILAPMIIIQYKTLERYSLRATVRLREGSVLPAIHEAAPPTDLPRHTVLPHLELQIWFKLSRLFALLINCYFGNRSLLIYPALTR